MYDVFYVSKGEVDENIWQRIKHQIPHAQKIEYAETFNMVQAKSFTRFFWVIWDHIVVREDFKFNYRINEWDEKYIHVFKNGNYFDGVCIFSKSARILQREWEYRFFTNKKEIDITVSDPKPYDVVFISYYESFAAERLAALLRKLKHNYVVHVKDVKGIHQAHVEAAKKISSEMFYVVDADAIVLDDFNFDYQIPYYDSNAKATVHVWHSRNPVNNLEYGNGGVKLLPRRMTMDMDISKPDMTTSISKWFKSIPIVSNINGFNTDPFNTWKSAFRECCKLASRVIDRQDDAETQHRLEIWCEQSLDEYATAGARAGKIFGETNRTNLEELKKINDFAWLKEQFDAR
jgi:hypothetical protein